MSTSTTDRGKAVSHLIAEGLGELFNDLPGMIKRMRAQTSETDVAVLIIARDAEHKYRATLLKREELLAAIREGDPDFAIAIGHLSKYQHPGDTCVVLYHERADEQVSSFSFVFSDSRIAPKGIN